MFATASLGAFQLSPSN